MDAAPSPKNQMIQILGFVVLLSLVCGGVGVLRCTLEAADDSSQELISRLDELKFHDMQLPTGPLRPKANN